MKLKVNESKGLDEGVYQGTVASIKEKIIKTQDGDVPYLDIVIQPDKADFEITYGCSQNVSSKSKLGKVLSKFVNLDELEEVDPEQILVGKQVSFMVQNEETDQGVFSRIVDGSIKPVTGAKAPAGK